MAQVRVTVTADLAEALRDLARVQRALLPPSITRSVGEGADVFVRGARRRAPRRSGRLAASINKTPAGPYAWDIAPDTIYAGVQEFGAHIEPVTADALVFEGSGGLVFTDEVDIPASPYMGPTFVADTSEAVRAVERAISQAIG